MLWNLLGCAALVGGFWLLVTAAIRGTKEVFHG